MAPPFSFSLLSCLSYPQPRPLFTVPFAANVDSSLFLPLLLRTRSVRPNGIDNSAMQVLRRDAWRWFPPFTRPGEPGQPRAAVRACAYGESERGRIESDGRSRDEEGCWGKGRGIHRYGEGV